MSRITYADRFQPSFGIPWVPMLPRERLERMSVDELKAYAAARNLAEANARDNPVGCGWTLPSWRQVMKAWPHYSIHIFLGGNQAAKTTFCSRLMMAAAGSIPEAETYCFHVNAKRSIDDQQRFIWEAIPNSIKEMPVKRSQNFNLQYSQKNGFTDNICILPPQPGYTRGGSINFYNYEQYFQNAQIIEGIKAHAIWADEVIPLGLMETLKYRLFTYHGRLIISFTVVDGWNDTIEKILSKTRTIEKRYSETMKMDLPVMQESLSMDSCCIHYAWTEDNPFTDIKEFWKMNATADTATKLARAYGIPTKSIAGIFPFFDVDVNMIAHEELPWTGKPDYPVTRYMACDPAGSKNWFMLWVAVDAKGTWWVYREWPDYDDWALSGGKDGPAMKGSGKGIRDYVDLIKDSEGEEEIYERFIDPRMGAAERPTQEGATTIISELDGAGMTFLPAAGLEEDHGLQLINDQLGYDKTKPVDGMNCPKLFISDRCQNLIFALKEYTKTSRTEPCKDPVDVLRYLAVSDIRYIEPASAHAWGQTGGY